MSAPKFSGDSDVRREVQAILGYYELEMWDEALSEAADAEARLGERTEFEELRIAILQEAKRWNEMRLVAERCSRREPTRPSWFIAWAYALRRERSIAEARAILELAITLHPKEALIPFNLACYAAQTDRLIEARRLLEQAVALDPALGKLAATDPDLAPLRGEGKGKTAPLDKPKRKTKSKAELIKEIAEKITDKHPQFPQESPQRKQESEETFLASPMSSPLSLSKPEGRKKEGVSPLAEALYAVTRKLIEGDSTARALALHALVESKAESLLVAMLALEEPGIAPLAMRGLWECWLNEEGPAPRTEIERGMSRLDKADYPGAEEVFARLIASYPAWAEPVNKLATVCYLEKRYEESLALCRQVVRMKVDHFGAWQGMSLCAIQLGNWEAALDAARQSLRLQPQNAAHRELVRSLEKKVSDGTEPSI